MTKFGPGRYQQRLNRAVKTIEEAIKSAKRAHKTTIKPHAAEFNGSNFIVEFKDILYGDSTTYIIPKMEAKWSAEL